MAAADELKSFQQIKPSAHTVVHMCGTGAIYVAHLWAHLVEWGGSALMVFGQHQHGR